MIDAILKEEKGSYLYEIAANQTLLLQLSRPEPAWEGSQIQNLTKDEGFYIHAIRK